MNFLDNNYVEVLTLILRFLLSLITFFPQIILEKFFEIPSPKARGLNEKFFNHFLPDPFRRAITFNLKGTELQNMVHRLMLPALLLIIAASASPDEVSGVVLKVVDGDTFEIQGFGLVRLADIDSPEMGTIEGVHAREYALENLLGVQVFIDIDDSVCRKPNAEAACVAYLANRNGTPNLNRNFNKMIVQSGYAVVRNDTRNEFDPVKW